MSEPRGGWVSTLDWGVKQTFRSYVHGVGGAILARGGATRSGDGGFTFLAEEDSSLRRAYSPFGSPIRSSRSPRTPR